MPVEDREVVDLFLVDTTVVLRSRGQRGDGDKRHSWRSIMPDIPSKMAGRSVPEID